MGAFADWIRQIFGGKDPREEADAKGAAVDYETLFRIFREGFAAGTSDAIEICARTAAMQAVSNLIAATLAKCEVRVYQGGKPVRNREWYRWNYRPNVNYSSSAFFAKFADKLVFDGEALVVEVNPDAQIVVADRYTTDTYTVFGNVYKGVTADGFTFDKSFGETEVTRFRLFNKKALAATQALAKAWDRLASKSAEAFARSLGRRAVLGISSEAQKNQNFDEIYAQLTGTDLKSFIQSDSAVLPLYNGFDYKELERNKTYQGDTSRDLAALVTDQYNFAARSWNIPPSLLLGEVAESSQAYKMFLSSCIDPLAEMIGEEISDKLYGSGGVLRGNYVELDTTACLHVDVLSEAGNADKLIGSATASPNEIRRIFKLPQIPEPWADAYYMTSNYHAAGTDETRMGSNPEGEGTANNSEGGE